jgi:tetratricopeptide (TPR) repeat protein
MRRTSRWLTIAFVSLLIGAVLGAVVAGFLFFERGPAAFLAKGESSYKQGMKAVREGDQASALVKFHEAILSSENVLKELDAVPADQQTPAEQLQRDQLHLGQAHWLKYRAVKARSFTKLLVDKKPLPSFEGQAEGAADEVMVKLSPLRLPEEESRREAVTSLREAAYRLPKQAEVLKEAVATEIQIEPMPWNHIHAFASTLHELDPQDDRALYLLARLEFEQPVAVKADGGQVTVPLPALKRSRDRMIKGLDLVTKLKALEPAPRYRTLYLEAQMHAWLAQFYRQPGQMKPDAELKAQQSLRAMLFDPEKGVVARTKREDKLSVASKLDLQGLYGLHQMALELALEDGRNKTAEAKTVRMQEIEQAMEAVSIVAAKTQAPMRMTDVTDFVVQACLKVMPSVVSAKPEVWNKYRDLALALSARVKSELRANHPLPLRLADLLTRESQWLMQTGQKAPSQARVQEATDWLDAGIKASTQPNSMLTLSLHESKLKLLLQQREPRGKVEPSIEVLRNSKTDHYQAAAAYYDGVLAEREGKLQYARTMLEAASRSSRSDLNRRSLSLLAPIYLTLDMPEKALQAMDGLQRHLDRLQSMSEEERAWLFTMIRSPEELAYDRVQALVMAANQAHRKLQAKTSKQADIRKQLAQYEADAIKCIGSITNPIMMGKVKLCYAQYLLQHDRIDDVQPILAQLQRDHADWLEVLQLDIGYRMAKAAPTGQQPLPPALVLDVDNLIYQYMKRPQAHPAGKIVWLKWLATTARGNQVAKLMNDPQFFSNSEADKRLKAFAFLYSGNSLESNNLLKSLPKDPQLDVALLQTAHTLADQQKVLVSALQQHQDQGLFRTWSAGLALAKGDYAEASRSFIQCLEYSKVRPLVRQGLVQALTQWSNVQPQEARKLCAEALQQYSSEPSLLLGFALASMTLGELGSPNDTGDQVKDMASALKAYEAACTLEGQEPGSASWLEAQCWLQADRRDFARMKALRTLELQPQHEGALALAVQLLLDQNDAVSWDKALQLTRAFQKQTASKECVFWQGKCHAKLGQYNDALACFRQVMEQAPQFSPVYQATCQVLLKSGTPEALVACQQVVNRWRMAIPDDSVCMQSEMELAIKHGKKSECRSRMEQYLVALENRQNTTAPIQTVSTEDKSLLSKQKADALCLLSQTMMQSSELTEAESMLKKAIELVPQHEAAMLLLGDCLTRQLRAMAMGTDTRKQFTQQAIAQFSTVYRRHKGHMLAGNNLAWLLVHELQDANEAYRIMQEVRLGKHRVKPMSGDQLSPEVLDTMGMVYAKLNKIDLGMERVELFEAARKRYADDARIACHLGQAYLSVRDTRRSMQAFQSARTLLVKSTYSAEEQRKLNQQIQAGMQEAESINTN